jgi:hypothetical protein
MNLTGRHCPFLIFGKKKKHVETPTPGHTDVFKSHCAPIQQAADQLLKAVENAPSGSTSVGNFMGRNIYIYIYIL